ncbi:hypothetical protein CHE218_26880 [Microbacterium sp. che218]
MDVGGEIDLDLAVERGGVEADARHTPTLHPARPVREKVDRERSRRESADVPLTRRRRTRLYFGL